MGSQHHAKSGGHRHFGGGNIAFVICHVICLFRRRSPLRLNHHSAQSGGLLGTVVVEI